MDIQKEREAFEKKFPVPAHWIDFCGLTCKYICKYNVIDDQTLKYQARWESWQAAKAQAVQECKWTQNEDGYFDASCGQSFVFSEPEDKPSKHKFTHGCCCGGKLVEAQEPAND